MPMGATVCRRSTVVLVAETMEELVGKFEKWKKGLEDKGLRVNAVKTKVMISSSEARSGFEGWKVAMWSLQKRRR